MLLKYKKTRQCSSFNPKIWVCFFWTFFEFKTNETKKMDCANKSMLTAKNYTASFFQTANDETAYLRLLLICNQRYQGLKSVLAIIQLYITAKYMSVYLKISKTRLCTYFSTVQYDFHTA